MLGNIEGGDEKIVIFCLPSHDRPRLASRLVDLSETRTRYVCRFLLV